MNELLCSYESLEKLSLELSTFDPQTVKNTICIQNGQTLKTLDLETWSLAFPRLCIITWELVAFASMIHKKWLLDVK